MGFPLTDPKTFPLALGDLIDLMAEAETLRHLSLVPTTQGQWQASHKSAYGGYKVVIKDTPWEAVLGALAPDYGKEWGEVVPGLEIEPDDEEEDLL